MEWNRGRAGLADLAGARQAGEQSGLNQLRAMQAGQQIKQDIALGDLAKQYVSNPNPQTLQEIAAINPERAKGLLGIQQEVIKQKAQGMKSLSNTFASASESQKAALYPKLIEQAKKSGLDTSNVPLEYNKNTSEEIKNIFMMESQKADQILGIEPKERKIIKDINERQRYADTGEYVFKDIKQGAAPREKAPSGYRYTESGTLEAIPGGPATKTSAEQAGKIALVKMGLKDIQSAKKDLFDNGKLNRVKVAALKTEIPFTDFAPGRIGGLQDTYSKLYNAVEAKLRLESGQAVPETEVRRATARFIPNVQDSDSSAKNKLERLENFLKEANKEFKKGRQTGEEMKDISSMSDDELLQGL